MARTFNNLVVGAVVALTLCSLLASAANVQKYTKPSLEVGKRLRSYVQGLSPGYPQEYGFGYYYQGDILLKPSAGGRLALNEQFILSYWPNATVPYVISPGFTPEEQDLLQEAFAQFADRTCVRFVPHTDQPQFVNITNTDTGCFAYVGRNPLNQYNRINLQTPSCMRSVGTPVHEMMHVLGFLHEFTRPDRDDWVSINVTNLIPDLLDPQVFETNFGKNSADETTSYDVEYNYGSVMHYSRYAGAIGLCCPVLDNLQPYLGDFGNEAGLADSDVEQVNARYCPTGVEGDIED